MPNTEANARKLLELTIEYANQETKAAELRHFGFPPGRTPDEIATEYGEVLRKFLAG